MNDKDLLKIKQSLKKIIKEVVDEDTKPCLRLYQAQITTPPNGATCGVQLIGDNNSIDLPYSNIITSAKIGDFVWVATIYDSFSNAIVYAPIDFDIVNIIYPVECIYISINETSPASLFGGSWVQIQGRFLLGASSNYLAGSEGGSADAIVVQHDGHLFDWSGYSAKEGTAIGKYLNISSFSTTGDLPRGWNVTSGNEMYPAGQSKGESGVGKNMPPYLVVYMWKRIE